MLTIDTITQAINADNIIVLLFLTAIFAIGLWYSRGVRTVEQYAVGDKKFSTWVITLTIVATFLSSSTFDWALKNMYLNGWKELIRYIARGAALYFVGSFVAVRVGSFLNALSVAEVMGNLYGRLVRGFVALVVIFSCVSLMAMQLKTCGKQVASLLGYKEQGDSVMIVVTLLLIIYTAWGGMRAATITDVWQFMVFALCLPFFLVVVWSSKSVQTDWRFVEALRVDTSPSGMISGGVFFFERIIPVVLTHGLGAAVFQRTLMAKDIYQVKRAYRYATLIWMVIVGFLFALSVLIRSHGVDPSNKGLGEILERVSIGVLPLKGLLACALLAMAMSTADSYSQAGGIHLRDLFQACTQSKRYEMWIVRIGAFFLGIIALAMALFFSSSKSIGKIKDFVYAPLVVVPLLFTLGGFRTTKRVMGFSFVLGMAGMVIWQLVFSHINPRLALGPVHSNAPGLLIMPPILLAVHYLSGAPGGWVGNRDLAPLQELSRLRQHRRSRITKAWQRFSWRRFVTRQQPAWLGHFFLLGVSLMIGHLLGTFCLKEEWVKEHFSLLFCYMLPLLCATTFLMTYPAWPPFVQGRIVQEIGYLLSATWGLLIAPPFLVWMGAASKINTTGAYSIICLFCLLTWLTACQRFSAGWVLAMTLLSWGVSAGTIYYFLEGDMPSLKLGGGLSTPGYLLGGGMLLGRGANCMQLRRTWYQLQKRLTLKQKSVNRSDRKYSWLHRQIGEVYDQYQKNKADRRYSAYPAASGGCY